MPEKVLEYRHLVTFGDTNVARNVYFARYFDWQGVYRERALHDAYPDFVEDLQRGFGFATEYAHMDFFHEAKLFDDILIRIRISDFSRTRIEFSFDFNRDSPSPKLLLASGKQAVIWVNAQHRPSLMPDELYDRLSALSRS